MCCSLLPCDPLLVSEACFAEFRMLVKVRSEGAFAMPHGWSTYTSSTIARLQAEGRGKGTKDKYRPWLTVRDISSLGLSTRAKGWKTGRVHHVLSNLELCYLYCLEWSSIATDIREQYPLPLEDTLHIAERLHVAHPTHPKTHTPVVMTTDFVVTCMKRGTSVNEARSVKPAEHLARRRTLEKLEIERVYWAERGTNWGIVTEHECVPTLAQNIQLIHEPRHYATHTSLTSDEFAESARLLTHAVERNAGDPLRRATSYCDRQLGLEPGTSLSLAYYLIATRQWLVNMYVPIDPTQPIMLQEIRLDL